ncbi:hypothetical protein Hanom_Chr09g00787741 [Helianthus anomalus]
MFNNLKSQTIMYVSCHLNPLAINLTSFRRKNQHMRTHTHTLSELNYLHTR